MAPKKSIIFRQEDFLYELNWDQKIDGTFIQVLAYEARVGNFVVGNDNNSSLIMAQTVIQKKHGEFFSLKYICKKLGILKTRHTTFGYMLSLPGVLYNETSNVVTASDEVWKTILKAHTFAFAYRTYGDSEWEELKTIFAPRVIEKNPGDEVIVLSSDDDEAAPPVPIPSMVDFRGNDNTLGFGNPMPPTTVVNISSDSSSTHFNVWDYLNHFSDSEGSLNTEGSTANSRVRGPVSGPSPLKPKDKSMPRPRNIANLFGLSSSGSNHPSNKDNGKGAIDGANDY